jgi:hypothetical protein
MRACTAPAAHHDRPSLSSRHADLCRQSVVCDERCVVRMTRCSHVCSFGDPAAYFHEPDHPHSRVPDFSGACPQCTPPVHGEVVFLKCTDPATREMDYKYAANPPPARVASRSSRRGLSRRSLGTDRGLDSASSTLPSARSMTSGCRSTSRGRQRSSRERGRGTSHESVSSIDASARGHSQASFA